MIHTLVLPVPPPMSAVNAYVIEGAKVTLVDTGLKAERVWQALQAGLADRGLDVAGIGQVIVTHAHMDHCGLARRIVEESEARVLAHAAGIDCLTSYQAEMSHYADLSATRLSQAGAPQKAWDMLRLRTMSYKAFVDPLPVGRVAPLEDGQVLDLEDVPWQVLSTPGHCLGHLCLYQPGSGRLISGDCLLPDYSFVPVSYPIPAAGTRAGQVAGFARSLELLAGLDIREVLPGHGSPVHGAHVLLARERAHLAGCRKELAAALARGRQTAYELWRECAGPFQSYDVLTGIETVCSYLEAMQDEGTAIVEEGPVITYCCSP